MDFIKHCVKGKEVLMQKEEDIKSFQNLGIDKSVMLEERSTKMSKQMFQHLSQEFEVAHKDCVIEGKVDGQARGLPNFE